MEIKVKAMGEDGSVAFEGTLDAEQLSFIISVGVNYLLSEGAGSFLEPEVDIPIDPHGTIQ